MGSDDVGPQRETRSEVVNTRATPEEKRRIEVVAGFRGVTVSRLLRILSVNDALKEFERLAEQREAVERTT